MQMKEGTVANQREGISLHPQCWWSKESTMNRQKMVLEEINHLEEVKHIATSTEQCKWSTWTRWENAKD